MKAGYASLRPESQATPALSKKEMPKKEFRRVSAATNAPRVGSAVAFGKATQNF